MPVSVSPFNPLIGVLDWIVPGDDESNLTIVVPDKPRTCSAWAAEDQAAVAASKAVIARRCRIVSSYALAVRCSRNQQRRFPSGGAG